MTSPIRFPTLHHSGSQYQAIYPLQHTQVSKINSELVSKALQAKAPQLETLQQIREAFGRASAIPNKDAKFGALRAIAQKFSQIWNVHYPLGIVKGMGDEDVQSAILCDIAPKLTDAQMNEVLEIVQNTRYTSDKCTILSAIVEKLDEVQLNQVFEVFINKGPADTRFKILQVIAPKLNEVQLSQFLENVARMTNEFIQCLAICSIVPSLAETHFDRVLEMLSTQTNQNYQCSVFESIIPRLTEGRLNQVITIVNNMNETIGKSTTFFILIKRLIKLKCYERVSEIMDSCPSRIRFQVRYLLQESLAKELSSSNIEAFLQRALIFRPLRAFVVECFLESYSAEIERNIQPFLADFSVEEQKEVIPLLPPNSIFYLGSSLRKDECKRLLSTVVQVDNQNIYDQQQLSFGAVLRKMHDEFLPHIRCEDNGAYVREEITEFLSGISWWKLVATAQNPHTQKMIFNFLPLMSATQSRVVVPLLSDSAFLRYFDAKLSQQLLLFLQSATSKQKARYLESCNIRLPQSCRKWEKTKAGLLAELALQEEKSLSHVRRICESVQIDQTNFRRLLDSLVSAICSHGSSDEFKQPIEDKIEPIIKQLMAVNADLVFFREKIDEIQIQHKVPDKFFCCIGGDIMKDPVKFKGESGICERGILVECLQKNHGKSPFSREPKTEDDIEECLELKAEIEGWKQSFEVGH